MRIILIEDEPDLGNAIKKTLNQHNYIVDLVLDGQQAWDYLETPSLNYDLGIFDWLLPHLSGIELIKRLRKQNNPLPILMLTAKDSLEERVIGLDAGADDYLVKPFGMVELLARIRALQRRSPQLQPQQLEVGNLTLDYATNTVKYRESSENIKIIELTSKEFQLLEYFMRHPNQILTRDQLLEQLWEIGLEPVSNVVAAQIRLLRKKLAQYQCDDLIETVYGLGYRFNS
ncbi:two-component system response regulator RppA [Microcystis aeruginosa]|jgi:DNA-binding response OmpR family regulator|uniref:Response regulator n=1 Tax=Microcystis aeruginosa FD4 TaxID=2686288 RepID=A0A857D492_MICAE|nr:two-component system response regulator RppA [Microcystis aeruginosa]MDJ0506526.1 response regulator transcription factor [Nostocales cyanobacterium LE14-WE12]NCR08332.1 response regulator transcription factor [Microcystis aeruginosa LG13-11]QGZ90392.1 response regulator [Microcystis aeruginosa FD4]